MAEKIVIKGKKPRYKPRSKPKPSKVHKTKKGRIKHKRPWDFEDGRNVFLD
jgi:hypothetical protein